MAINPYRRGAPVCAPCIVICWTRGRRPKGAYAPGLLPIAALWSILTPPFQGCRGCSLKSDHICTRRVEIQLRQTASLGMPRLASNASMTRQDISGFVPCLFIVYWGPLVEFSERGRTRIVSDPLPPRLTFTRYGLRALSRSLNRTGDLGMTNLSIKALASFNYGNK
jgi:hypothetical protein